MGEACPERAQPLISGGITLSAALWGVIMLDCWLLTPFSTLSESWLISSLGLVLLHLLQAFFCSPGSTTRAGVQESTISWPSSCTPAGWECAVPPRGVTQNLSSHPVASLFTHSRPGTHQHLHPFWCTIWGPALGPIPVQSRR